MRVCVCVCECVVRMTHGGCDKGGDGVNYDPECVSFECLLVSDSCKCWLLPAVVLSLESSLC